MHGFYCFLFFVENNFTRVYCEISSDNSAEKLKISIIFNDKLIWLESCENTLRTKAILNVHFFSNFNCISFVEIKRMNWCIFVNVHFHSTSIFPFPMLFLISRLRHRMDIWIIITNNMAADEPVDQTGIHNFFFFFFFIY